MAKAPATKPPATKAPAAKKAPAKADAAPRTDGIHKPVQPSADLAALVGEGPLPRSQIVSKIWEYIKAHDLQDPKDKRQINADAKLEKIFGGKKASMFEMNKHISKHVK